MGRNKKGDYSKDEFDAFSPGIRQGNNGWRRKRKERIVNQPPAKLNVHVHGLIFAVLAVVFVVYPLAQWAFGI